MLSKGRSRIVDLSVHGDLRAIEAAILLDESLYNLPCDFVGVSNPMLISKEFQEQLDGCVIELQSIWPAIFPVQVQQVFLGMLSTRQFTFLEKVNQLIQVLTVIRLVQYFRENLGRA